MRKESITLFILSCLFYVSISADPTYYPLNKRNFNIDVSDICYYEESNPNFRYVKPCPQGYKCENLGVEDHKINICKEYKSLLKTFGADCKEDWECSSNLVCNQNKCTIDSNKNAYSIDSEHYCPDTQVVKRYYNSETFNYEYTCQTDTEKCLDNGNNYLPSPLKVCGEIDSFDSNFNEKSVKMDYIGSVKEGAFVRNQLACETGFALQFYEDGKTTSPSHYRCVTLVDIDDSCNLEYSIGGNKYFYNGAHNGFPATTLGDCKLIKVKIDLFKKYVARLNAVKNNCDRNKYYDEPYTCGDDELRKLYYFYSNPTTYLAYKNEEVITEYLIQKKYPTYNAKIPETDSNEFISFKFISLLFMLLFL